MILQISISIDMEFKTMKIIITENQLKNKVRQMVKTEGWKDTCEMLGLSGEEFNQMFFNNDPMEFLNLYNDLDVVQSKNNPYLTLFRYEPGHNLIIYDKSDGFVFMDNYEIFSVINVGFDTGSIQAVELIKEWLSDVYGLNDVKVSIMDFRDQRKIV